LRLREGNAAGGTRTRKGGLELLRKRREGKENEDEGDERLFYRFSGRISKKCQDPRAGWALPPAICC
jgi:hypothetical protein